MVGLYGLISYVAARRRNEIGVRMALGADRGQIVGMVMREAGYLLLMGIVIGQCSLADRGTRRQFAAVWSQAVRSAHAAGRRLRY